MTAVLEGRRISIRGIVQGVGFRPWVYRLAHETGIRGSVRNDSTGVLIEAFGSNGSLAEFIRQLESAAPPAASIAELTWEAIPAEKRSAFEIERSESGPERRVSIPADLATCDKCLEEIFDPTNRRYRYAFTNCTDCGPRFTIVREVPYDRPATTMSVFDMCPRCQAEYDDPGDRRFHAQPNACPDCGPRLRLLNARGDELTTSDPIAAAARSLAEGRIVALKGLGGFHLACDATSSLAVARLRQLKRRDAKPFAVMVRDLEAAESLATLGPGEKTLLESVERPIVLAPLRAPSALAPEVAPAIRQVGIMLPYTPLHHLLLADVERPLVMTSANLSEEPIAYRNGEAVERLNEIADLLLVHDREIETRCEDSVARVILGTPQLIRRSRGYVPRPVHLRHRLPAPVLACGAHLKNTFCI
ncbi:MAG TPA: carbamoyltransferase HypF, partial [Thermoanaerobaculia bacterium]|nr:carbamoyltransferase HypF [Thermoanaerobaculia bacterium]